MVSKPIKIFGGLLNNNLVTLLLVIVVAVVLFCLYKYFYPVKEHFATSLTDILNSSISSGSSGSSGSSSNKIPVTEAQKELLKQSGLLAEGATVATDPSRIIGLEALCANINEPSLLPGKTGSYGEGCGWYFKEDPDDFSFPAYGNKYGPLNPALKDVARGGQWYFDNLDKAQKAEDLKHCLNIKTCQLADLHPGKCAWCGELGYGIPIDESGLPKYPDDDSLNCLGAVTTNINKCKYDAQEKIYQTDGDGNLIPQEPNPKPICNTTGGILSKECLLFLAKAAGFKDSGAAYRVINGDPDGYNTLGSDNNRIFKAAFDVLNYRASIPYDKNFLGGGNCARDAALVYFKKIVKQTAYGVNPKTRSAALFLVRGDKFKPDDIDPNAMPPFDLAFLQSLFKEVGGQEAGTGYPTKDNINSYNNGYKLGTIMNAFTKTCKVDVLSKTITVQQDAVKKCLGINVQLPLAGCDLQPPPYVPTPNACNPGNILIGSTTDAPTKGVEIFWYSYDNDLTFPERRQQVATYFGRQIKLSVPSVSTSNIESIPFDTTGPLAFVARSVIKYMGPVYNATYAISASEGAAVKVNSKIILRNWKANTAGTGTTTGFKVESGDKNYTEVFWCSSKPSSGSFLMSMIDSKGDKGPIQAASCELRVAKDFPVARWDFFTGSTDELNGILSTKATSTAAGTFQNKPCLNFSGSSVITDNKIAGSAFRSMTAMIYYNSIGTQASNRIFLLCKSNGVKADEPTNYKSSDAFEVGITKTGAVFANLKPANGSTLNLLSATTPEGMATPNTWIHVGVSCSQDFRQINIYINGVKQGTGNGDVVQSYYDKMIFDFAAIGSGYAQPSSMSLNGGIAWLHWFDYQLCADGIAKDMKGGFCNTAVYPITQNYSWPMTCALTYVPPPAAAPASQGPTQSGTFIVAGGKAKLAYSQDGGNTYVVSQSGSNLFSAALSAQVLFVSNNGSQWLAGGQSSSGAKLATSTDGINWTNVTSMDNYGGGNGSFDAAIWTGSQWIMQCTNLLKNYATDILTSTNGMNWSLMKLDFSNISQTAMNGATVVMSGTNVNMFAQHAIFYSTDSGATFQFAPSADTFFNGNGGLYCVAYGGGKFLAGGCGNAWGGPPILIYSSDGINWTQADISKICKDNRIWNVYYVNNRWYATTQLQIITSTDAVNWTSISIPLLTQGPYVSINKTSFAKVGTGFVAGLANGAMSSSDGNSWSMNPTLTTMFNQGLNAITVGTGAAAAGQAPVLAPVLRIVDASYGKNCNGTLQGNRTAFFTSLVNGASSLQNYPYDYTKTGGDPAPGCRKTLEITYNCGGGANNSFYAPPEAGYNPLVNLSCSTARPSLAVTPPPPPPAPPAATGDGPQPTNITTGTNTLRTHIITFDKITNPQPAVYGFVYSNSLAPTVPNWGVNVFPFTKATNMKNITGGKILGWLNQASAFKYVAPIAIYTDKPDSFDLIGYISKLTIPASAFYELNLAYVPGGDPSS